MIKKNGFVFMETIVVISVLSITLLLLFSSYSYILRKSRSKNQFDTTETIYKTYYIKDILDTYYPIQGTSYKSSVANFVNNNSYYCSKVYPKGSTSTPSVSGFTTNIDAFSCDLSAKTDRKNIKANDKLYQAVIAYEVEKIYYLNPYAITTYETNATKDDTWLGQFDATTIDYIQSLAVTTNKHVMIVKYKKNYNYAQTFINDSTNVDLEDSDNYEVIHSSMEVDS